MDFDGDGCDDILSGSWPGALYLFRGQADGSFDAGTPILDRDGRPVQVELASTVFAFDWDRDGDLDLLVGSISGRVYLIENEGTRETPKYGAALTLVDDERLTGEFGGDSHPIAADWDGDGRLDLLVGTGSGRVVWYRNVGPPRTPRLAEVETLVPPADDKAEHEGPRPGTRAKISAVDWDGDGRLDLLVGDLGPEFVKQLSDEEAAWREELRQQQAEVFVEWSRVFRNYREQLSAPQPHDDGPRCQYEEDLQALRERLQELSRVRERLVNEADSLKPGTQRHGRVWLFLRRS